MARTCSFLIGNRVDRKGTGEHLKNFCHIVFICMSFATLVIRKYTRTNSEKIDERTDKIASETPKISQLKIDHSLRSEHSLSVENTSYLPYFRAEFSHFSTHLLGKPSSTFSHTDTPSIPTLPTESACNIKRQLQTSPRYFH